MLEINETFPLTSEKMQRYNSRNQRIKLIFPNTKGLNPDILKMASNNITFSILGGLSPKKRKFDNEHYRERTYYSGNELASIISQYEKIEREINPIWSDLEKAMFVYNKLCEYFEYSENRFNGRDASRNLLGMITGKSVCSGFAMLYKEAMDRLGIKCYYQNKKSSHSWCILEVEGKYYGTELTWDTYNKVNNKCGFLYFGRHNQKTFYANEHHDISKDDEERQFPLSVIPDKKLVEMLKKISKPRIIKYELLPIIYQKGIVVNNVRIDFKNNYPFCESLPTANFTRNDGSCFVLFHANKFDVDKGVYEYVFIECRNGGVQLTKIYSEADLLTKDESLRSLIANNLLSSSRVKDKIDNYNGYVGYVVEGKNYRYYNQYFEERVINKYR